MAPLKPLEDTLYNEVVARIKQDDASVPYRERGWWYYARFVTGKDYPVHARRKDAYDDLVHEELVGFLERHPETFDVIVSADTLVYFGALDGFATAAASALRPGGWVVFTLEEAAPETETFHLEVHGRYNHAAPYVEAVLTAAGLTPHVGHAVLRNESGLPVQGLVVRARKGARGDRG